MIRMRSALHKALRLFMIFIHKLKYSDTLKVRTRSGLIRNLYSPS